MSAKNEETQAMIRTALAHRFANGRHLHHRDCIHNMPAEEQIAMRGKTTEWWMAMGIPFPEQITPDDWECESPFRNEGEFSGR